MTEISTKKKYGKLLGGYGLGLFFNQSINLLIIPVLWRTLKPEDFGVIATAQIITLFLVPIYLFGLSDTIQRYYYRWTEESRKHHLGWFFWFIFAFTLILTLLLDTLGSRFSKYFISQVDFDPILRYTIWSVFFYNFINIPVALSRIKEKILNYNILVNGSFVTQIILILYFVKVEHLGAYGYVRAILISNILWFLPTLFFVFRDCALFPAKKFMQIPLRFSAPLCFAGIIEGISLTLDRYFLDKYIPLAAMGFYNLARQLSSPIHVVNMITKLISFPFLHKQHAEEKDTKQILSVYGMLYTVIMTVPVVAISTLAPEVIAIFDPSGIYLQIVPYIPYFCIAFYINSLSTIHGRGMDLVGKSVWSFAIPLVGIILSLGVYWYALPRFGIYGALLGVIANYLGRTLVNNVLAFYYLPREYHFRKILLSWVLAAIFYTVLINIRIDQTALSAVCDIFGIALLCFALYRFVIKDELAQVFSSKLQSLPSNDTRTL